MHENISIYSPILQLMAIVNGTILPFNHFSICLLLNALCISIGIYSGVEPLPFVGNVLFLN